MSTIDLTGYSELSKKENKMVFVIIDKDKAAHLTISKLDILNKGVGDFIVSELYQTIKKKIK